MQVKASSSSCLLYKSAVTAVCLWAAEFSSAIEYWHTYHRAKTNSKTAHFKSKQLLLFVFELQDSLLPSSTGILTAVQRRTAVTAYLSSKQLLLFVFELQDSLLPSSIGILTAVRRQTAVTAYLSSKQLLLFANAGRNTLIVTWYGAKLIR